MNARARLADQLARAHVLDRDRYRCVHCGKSIAAVRLDWSHIHGRGNRYIRWEPDNAVTLCRPDHRYFTDHPRQWRRWIAERYGPDRWDDLLAMEAAGERRGDSVDVEAVIRGFQEMQLTPVEMERFRSGAWLG